MAGLADAKDDCVTEPSGTLFSSQHAEIAASLKKMLICGSDIYHFQASLERVKQAGVSEYLKQI